MDFKTLVPGIGILKGMALTMRRMFQAKVTVQYPEVVQDISPRHRGRLQLLYDEYGTLKCETCFQCAAACPIERILAEEDYDPRRMLTILERTQDAYGSLTVAALKHISHGTGAWYAEIYGTASFYDHLRLEEASGHVFAICRCPACTFRGAGRVVAALEAALSTRFGQASPEGAVRLEPGDCHGASPERALVTLDGEVVHDVAPDAVARMASQPRAAHATAGRA